jgi:hypothetical protein
MECCLLRAECLTRIAGSTIECGAALFYPHPTLIKGGYIDNPDDRLALTEKRYQGAKEGIPGDKTAGTVNRVDDPEMLSILSVAAKLFTQKTMFRIELGDSVSQMGFNLSVDKGDRALILLRLNLKLLAKIAQ